jgi:hypothetical protein
MKKVYYLVVASCFLFVANGFAQNKRAAQSNPINLSALQGAEKNQSSVQPMSTVSDTITAHWGRILPYPSVDTATLYTCSPTKHSYLAGHNQYGDMAKAQKFDSQYGVANASGTITNLLMWVGDKKLGTTPGNASRIPTIWADNAGVPGTVLGTATPVTVALMDTSIAAKHLIGPSSGPMGIYNINATFTTTISIPVNHTFWAGFTITYDAAGDSAGLITTRGAEFKDSTHTFELYTPAPGTWASFKADWGLSLALAVYPVLNVTTAGVNEFNSNISALQNYPNPASNNTMISYSLKETANVNLTVYDIAGKKLSDLSQGIQSAGNHNVKLDVSNLSSGMYFYTIIAGDNKMTSKITVVR